MELYNLEFSKNIRFTVEDVIDYNIEGTFDPEAVCDTEFYGYRETTFTVTFDPEAVCDTEFYGYRETTFTVSSVEVLLRDGLWIEDETSLKEQFIKHYDDKLTLIVQNAIDDKQGAL